MGWSLKRTKAVGDGDDFTVSAVVGQAVPNAATPTIYQRISSIADSRSASWFVMEGIAQAGGSVARNGVREE